jgi:hypothetical protein
MQRGNALRGRPPQSQIKHTEKAEEYPNNRQSSVPLSTDQPQKYGHGEEGHGNLRQRTRQIVETVLSDAHGVTMVKMVTATGADALVKSINYTPRINDQHLAQKQAVFDHLMGRGGTCSTPACCCAI